MKLAVRLFTDGLYTKTTRAIFYSQIIVPFVYLFAILARTVPHSAPSNRLDSPTQSHTVRLYTEHSSITVPIWRSLFFSCAYIWYVESQRPIRRPTTAWILQLSVPYGKNHVNVCSQTCIDHQLTRHLFYSYTDTLYFGSQWPIRRTATVGLPKCGVPVSLFMEHRSFLVRTRSFCGESAAHSFGVAYGTSISRRELLSYADTF